MSGAGLRISRLVVTGRSVPPAEIEFRAGFNVLTGPSNTGKSYIVECVDFMFGADDPPDSDIKEAIGYETVFLELITTAGLSYTLERSLQGGDVRLYEAAFALRKEAPSRVLAVATQAKKKETLSSFLLGLMGVSDITLRKNAYGEPVGLTFRTISHLFVVNETDIIAKKRSPVRLTSGFAKTPSERAFSFLLTGQDDQSVITAPDIKDRVAQTLGRKAVYDDLISRLEAKTKDMEPSELVAQLEEAGKRISAATDSLGARMGEIERHQADRQAAFGLFHTAESRLIVVGELLARFTILKQHYLSDLKRLEFIAEGDYFFDQLVAVRCPLCGTSLDEHAAQKLCNTGADTLNDLQQACGAEAAKIRAHLADLEATILGLDKERVEVAERSRSSRKEVERVDSLLANELKPTFESQKKDLDLLLSRHRELSEAASWFTSLEEYRRDRAALDVAEKVEAPVFSGLSSSATRLFCDTVQDLLRSWKFLSPGEIVEFNEKRMDIVVAGKHRQSNGKGLRGFLHGAFTIGLMHYCRLHGFPHPGFVVLDSPITSYREGKVEEAEDEAPPEVQDAFWDHLAAWSATEQIILIENKEPTPLARSSAHYIHFVGPKGKEGRRGFFPSKADR